MRDLVVLLAMLVFIPWSLKNNFVGYLLWGWAGLIALQSYLYGFMIGVPYVMVFALITLFTWFSKQDTERTKWQTNRTAILFMVFVAHGLLCAVFSYSGLTNNWNIYTNLVKTVLFCILMPMILTNRLRIHAFLIMVVVAMTFHGALDGIKYIASGGGHHAQEIPQFGDNNHFAMVMTLIIPMQYYLVQYSSGRLARLAFATTIMLTVLAVAATNSRGGLLGLFAVAAWIILKSRRKVLGGFAIVVASLLVVQLAPDSWTQRMQTIKSAGDDHSFMERVGAWKVASAIAVANPILGGGFRSLQNKPIWDQFKSSQGLLGFVETPEFNRSGVAAHSIWFEVMSDTGFIGLIIFAVITHRCVTHLYSCNPMQQYKSSKKNYSIKIL